MEILTIEDLKDELQQEDYDAITGGDDSVAENCLENARERVSAALCAYGLEFDETDSAVRLAVLKTALHELYAYSADWVTAENYMDEAKAVLLPLAPKHYPESAKASGSESWKGFS
jgi:hypothetical protein